MKASAFFFVFSLLTFSLRFATASAEVSDSTLDDTNENYGNLLAEETINPSDVTNAVSTDANRNGCTSDHAETAAKLRREERPRMCVPEPPKQPVKKPDSVDKKASPHPVEWNPEICPYFLYGTRQNLACDSGIASEKQRIELNSGSVQWNLINCRPCMYNLSYHFCGPFQHGRSNTKATTSLTCINSRSNWSCVWRGKKCLVLRIIGSYHAGKSRYKYKYPPN